MLRLLKSKAVARTEKKAREDAAAKRKIAQIRGRGSEVQPEPSAEAEPAAPSDPVEDERVRKFMADQMKSALGFRGPSGTADQPLLGAPATKLTIRGNVIGTVGVPKRRRDTQAFSFPTHAETIAKKAREMTEEERADLLASTIASKIVQHQVAAARTQEEKDAEKLEKVAVIMSDPLPAPATNESEAQMNEIQLEIQRKSLEKTNQDRLDAIEAGKAMEARARQADEDERTAQVARDTAATAISSLPTALMTSEDYAARRSRLADEAVAKEVAKYGQITTTPITEVDRAALDERFGIGRLPSEEEQARLRAARGAVIPLTQSELTAIGDRRRMREDLDRTESDVREAKRRRIDLAPGLERAGATTRQLEEDVEMGRRGVAGAKQKAADDKRNDEIRVWKGSSPLDEASRSVPSALQDAPGLSQIAKERSSLWSRAVVKGVGSSLTASNKDFTKWLKSQGTKNVLNKAKLAYEGVIGDVQPRTDRGKKLKAIAASRIVDIEDQIGNIDEGKVQPSRLSRSGRDRSPAPRRKPRSRSRSPQVRKVDKSGKGDRGAEGTGFTKRRRKSKIVKVNKDPPSTSRYFI